MSAYRVTARRVGEWWALEVPDLPGVFSQAKRLERADEAAREAIAVMLDVDPTEVEVTIQPVLSDEEQKVLAQVEQAQEAARTAAENERRAMREAAAVLARDLSQRDAGQLLGVSFQRVSQLLKEAVGGPKKRRVMPRRAKTSA